MYRVELDGVTLYDPRLKDYDIFTPKLKLEVNKSGAFDFRIYPSHPLYNRIFKLKSIVEVYQDDTLLFRGRVLDDEMDFNKSKMVICEGELAYFNDSILRPYEFTGSVSNYLKLIVDQHNSQVQANRRFTLGNVTVTDPNNLIVRADSTYPKTWDVVQSKLIKLLGGYLMVRRENGVNYLDYLKDSNKISLQKIELGKNLLDLVTQSSASDVYTAILPLGKELDNDTGERLTIKSVNGGKDFIQDDDAVAKYGFIMQVGDWKDVTIASNLLTKARQELAQLIKLSLTLELTAIDLSMIDVDIDDFKVFEYVDVLSTPHGIDERLLVEKMEINLTSPDSNKITIGQQRKSLTDSQIETDKAVGNIEIIKGPKGDKGEQGLNGLQGEKGDQGLPGKPGENGQPSYAHIAYANSSDGSVGFSTSDSNGKLFMGMYVDNKSLDSQTPGDYRWTLIKGEDGLQGQQGLPGKAGDDGKTPYLHIAYANNSTGTSGFSTSDSVGKLYIGQYTDFNVNDSTDPTKYSWTKIKGEDGPKGDKGDQGIQGLQGIKGDQGIAGVKGTDGKTSYTHIAYADTADGGGFSQLPAGKLYMGVYVDFVATDSSTPSDYAWSLIKGADGAQGTPGKPGENGKTPYFHVAYANNATGTSGFSTTDSAGKLYIGQYTDFVQADSTDPTKYNWTKIKGEDGAKGDQGIQGPPGTNGTSQYVHIRYSANANGSAMTTTPQSNTQYIGLVTTTNATAPATNTSYTWSKFKGDPGAQGNQGIPGTPGANGQTTYTWVKYADTATGTGMSDSPDGKLYIGLAFNKTTQTESSTASDYTWSLMPQNVEIGAKNLLLKSDIAVTNSAYGIQRYDLTEVIKEDESVVLTLWGTLGSDRQSFVAYNSGGNVQLGALKLVKTGMYQLIFKWKVSTSSNTFLQIYQFTSSNTSASTIERIMLSRGNLGVDHQRAPEDVQAELDDKADNEYVTEVSNMLNTTIEEVAGYIRTEVSETYTEKSEFTTYQEAVSTQFEQTSENFNFNFTDLKTLINQMGNDSQASFEEIRKFIRFENGNIYLGSSDSDSELEITQDSINFKQSGVVVAYFSGQAFYINRGAVIESMQIGEHKIADARNGHTGFQWIGG